MLFRSIIGIQYEFEDELVIRNGLDAAIEQYPEVDLIVLSEYAFYRPPSWMPQWCDENDVHVMAGTVTLTDDIKRYFNSAIVWGPNGDLIFNQAKSQPVQFVESDRKSVVEGKRVDLGGRRTIKNKN